MTSPSVNVFEKDLTNIIPTIPTDIGGFVGTFNWGPVDQVTLISPDESKLRKVFGSPGTGVATDFLCASQFLSYSTNLKVVRVLGKSYVSAVGTDTALNSVAAVGDRTNTGIASILIKNTKFIENGIVDIDTSVNTWIAKYPGTKGDGIKIVVLTDLNFDEESTDVDVAYASSLFSSAPESTEIHIAIFDRTDGYFSGVAGGILETYSYLSLVPGTKKEDGSINYYRDVINSGSAYVWAGDSDDLDDITDSDVPFDSGINTGVYVLSGGNDGSVITDADIISGWDLFKNNESVDVSYLFTGAVSPTVSSYVVNNISAYRKDCVTFIAPRKSDVVGSLTQLDNLKSFKTALNIDTSYGFIVDNWKYMYNKYADRYEWVPCSPDIAGLWARLSDPWISGAGYNRGILKNVTRLAFNSTKAERDELYKISINSIISDPAAGSLLYGDKTALSKPSAFDRINVRMLFIVLEKAISKAAKYQLFEFNDQFTRAQFVSMVEPYLREIKSRRGIYDFRVVCDETNNTAEVIDSNSFVGDIYIKPARSINYINLNFIAVRTGVDFNEIVGTK